MDSLNEKITNINKEFDSKIASLNEEREAKIAQAKAESLIESVDSLPVFNLMTIFENVSPLLLKKKGGAKLIHKYISVIRGNKNLNEMHYLRENVSKIGELSEDKVKSTLKEALSFATVKGSKIDSDIVTVIKESLKKLDSSDVIAAFNVNDEATRINESIDYLLNTARDKKNFIEYDQKLSFLEEALSKKEDVVSESKKEVFEKEKNDCIQAIDEAWEKADSTLRMKLTEIKDRLSKKEFSEITVDDDIKYINQLKETIA